jgi:hypothetical protein
MHARGFVFLPIILLLLSTCGKNESSPPVLTDIRYQSPAYQRFFNEGEALMGGNVDFEDPDGDVVLLSVTWRDCGSGPVKRIDSLQDDLQNETSGSITFFLVIRTDCEIGDYIVELFISDGQDNRSNVLVAPYEIYE